MRKLMKKFSGLFLALVMMASLLPFTTAHAADGRLSFSDPSCAAGEKVEVKVRVQSDGNKVGPYEIHVKYDPKMLKFEEGDNASASNGIITVNYDGGESSDKLHILKFTALDNGETKLSVEDYDAEISTGEELVLTKGTSTVKIEGGTPVKIEDEDDIEDVSPGIEVMCKDQLYYIVSDFDESEVPEGFEKTLGEYEGQKVNAIVNDVTGQYIYVAENENHDRVYLFDDTTSNTLLPAEMVPVNKNVCIFIMDYPEDDKMPEHIKPTTMTLNEKKFKIWNNVDNQDFYYIYAFSSNGTKGYYEYDSVDKTYQRANVADFILDEEVKDEKSPLMEKLEDNVMLIIIASIALAVILLIIVIVLSVKLCKRGKQLKASGNMYDEDDYEYDSDYDKDDYEDEEDDYDEDDYDFEFDDYDDGDIELDDSFEEDYDFGFSDKPKQTNKNKSGKKSKKSKDDDFSIDFIEL